MNIRKLLSIVSIVLLAGAGACGSALAQTPPEAVMLVPGVYTTPEISAKCQAYAAKRVGLSGFTDNSRQAVALACVKKLWNQQQVKMKR